MPCYSCSSEFGFLKKEVGCEVCGFSFCTRCCKKREIPSNTKELNKKLVCNKCYDNLTNKSTERSKASPPLAHKKRMAALNKSMSVDSGCYYSNEKDKEIAERLQRLKRERIKDAVPTEEDIAERLAKLKGMDPAKFKAPPIEVYRRPNLTTAVEQASDLMEQVAIEVEMDSRLVKPEDEIAAGLARLRDEAPPNKGSKKPDLEIDLSNLQVGESPSEDMDIDKANLHFQEQGETLSATASQDIHKLINDPEYISLLQEIKKEKDGKESDDDEEEANKLVEKFLAANADIEGLDSLNDDTEENSKSEKDTTEEFPWCVICTEDAKIRCFGCDSDLYCMHCFKECHESLDIKDHKTCPFLPPKNPAL